MISPHSKCVSGTQTSDRKLALPWNISCIMISSLSILRVLLSLDMYQHIVTAKGSRLWIPERMFRSVITASEPTSPSFPLNYTQLSVPRLSANFLKPAQAAITQCLWVSSLNNRGEFPHSSGGRKSKIKVQQLWFLVREDSHLDLKLAAFSLCLRMLERHGKMEIERRRSWSVQGLGKGFARWLSGKDSPANAGDAGDVGLMPGSEKSPGGGNGKSTPVFLPGESHGQRSLAGCNPWGHEELDTTDHLGMRA